jgi:hypothetical protein
MALDPRAIVDILGQTLIANPHSPVLGRKVMQEVL